VGGARALRAACVLPSNVQKYPSIMSFNALSYSLYVGEMRVSSDCPVCPWWAFFLFSFLTPLLKLQVGSLGY
jgi:hypothetical protein